MRTLHVLGLSHTNLTDDYAWCAYTGKVRRFAGMMHDQGYPVITYHSGLGEENPDWIAGEYVQVITEETRQRWYPPLPRGDNTPPWTSSSYSSWNKVCVSELEGQVRPGDFLCFSAAGHLQKPIADAFPEAVAVEFGVGYEGTFTQYRCFESYAWMHCVYGHHMGAMNANGRNFDTVIPNYFDPAQFPLAEPDTGHPYLLFLARLEDRKGVHEALEVARHSHMSIVLAGAGEMPKGYDDVDYAHVGFVKPDVRANLLRRATALIQPTRYVEPFGGCVAEALMCGLPVITSDYGGFTDYVYESQGYRCRTLADYVAAVRRCQDEALRGSGELRRRRRQEAAHARFSMEACGPKYRKWFEALATGPEWYAGFQGE